MKNYFAPILCFLTLTGLWGQNSIVLKNSSFEHDRPACCKVPTDWINLGESSHTPPDIQPGSFGVDMDAQDGRTYLGLVVRASNTWEGVGQKLYDNLQKDSSYTFSLWMSRSNSYKSPTPLNQELVSFNAPTVLKIWGYNSQTKQEELLAESLPVSHSKWVKYEFVLHPTVADFNELDLMAYYAPGFEKQNGNLLIDNCSAIAPIKK